MIVHYLVNGEGQQNVTMTNENGIYKETVDGLSPGDELDYWYTY